MSQLNSEVEQFEPIITLSKSDLEELTLAIMGCGLACCRLMPQAYASGLYASGHFYSDIWEIVVPCDEAEWFEKRGYTYRKRDGIRCIIPEGYISIPWLDEKPAKELFKLWKESKLK